MKELAVTDLYQMKDPRLPGLRIRDKSILCSLKREGSEAWDQSNQHQFAHRQGSRPNRPRSIPITVLGQIVQL